MQLAVEDLQQPPGGLLLAQPAQLVQGLPLQIQQLGEFLLAAVGVLDAFGELALGALDHLLLLAEHLGLFFQRVLTLVQQPLALVQLAAEPAQFLFAFGLLLQGHLLDFQLGLAAAVLHLHLGLADDLAGLRLGVPAPQTIQQPVDEKRQRRRQHGHDQNNDNDYFSTRQ